MERLRLGVIGWPIGHSRSPAMQQAALRALGIDGDYRPFAVAPARLSATLAELHAAGVYGLNVTIPHKQAVLPLCQPDPLALAVGAVNTLIFDTFPPHGCNTDVHGFRMLLAESGARADGRVTILGAGGAARAVVAAVAAQASAIRVVRRTPRPLDVTGAVVEEVEWPTDARALEAVLRGTDLLVDATARGLDHEAAELPLAALADDAVVLDLVVRRETVLVQQARARGLRAATGVAMLLHQGAASFELWTGKAAPVEVMRQALEAALDDLESRRNDFDW